MQINANKVLDICLKVWYKGANANDSHYHLEGYTKNYGCSTLPEPTEGTSGCVQGGYAMAYVCNFQTAFSISGFFSGIVQKFLSIGGKLISLLDIFFCTFSLSVN
jgi:hypothetical protein